MARWCLFCSLVLCFFILSAARVSDENYRYFAIGAAADSDKEGVVMKSVDGIVWTDVQSTVFKNISSGEADKLYSVAVGDGVWIAFGNWKKKYLSVRGSTFNVTLFMDAYQVLCLAFGNGMWIACDTFRSDQGVRSSAVLYSLDGGNTFVHSPTGMIGLRDAVYAKSRGLWVGVSSLNGTVLSGVSMDGITWDTSGSNANSLMIRLYSVVFSERLNLFLAAGQKPSGVNTSPIISSVDGRNWTPLGSFSDMDLGSANDLAVAELANGTVVIVAVGDTSPVRRSQIIVSYDRGTTWIGKGIWFSTATNSSGAQAVCYNALDQRFVVVGRADFLGNGPVVYSDDFGATWSYGTRTNPRLLSREGFDVATYPLGALVDGAPTSTMVETKDLLLSSSLTVTEAGNVDAVGAVRIDNSTLRVRVDGRVSTGTVQVLTSQNGGIFGQFSNVQVLVDGCDSTASGTAVYQQYGLSVVFQLQGAVCAQGLPRSAIIGIAVGAGIGGIVIAVVVVLVMKAIIAQYTRDATARIKMKEMNQPLL